MSEQMVTSGVLDSEAPAQAPSLVAGPITAYLERQDKVVNEAVLDWMMTAFKKKVLRQLMTTKATRKGHDSNTMYSGPCAVKAWHQYHGSGGEPVKARAVLKWLLGDTVELDVVGIAQLAGVQLVDNNRDLFVTSDGDKVQVHPDGRVVVEDFAVTEYYNFECKSCDTFTFDAWLANGGPDDKWGYLTQASVEILAWREAGYDVNSTCFVAVSTGSRQGSIAEWIIPYDQSLVDHWHDRRRLARAAERPLVPFQAEMETEFVKGKVLDVDTAFVFGEPKPRLDKNGKVHGWDVATGRLLLPTTPCGYCAYKGLCWPGAELDVDSGKPKWVLKN